MDKTSEYGRIYSEVCNGFSKELIFDELVYFKHPTFAEHFANYSNYELLIKESIKKGVSTEKEKLEYAIENNWWSKEKESQIAFLTKTVKNLVKTKNKLLYHSQRESLDSQIKRNEAILLTYNKERKDVIGYTAEEYASNKLTEQLLIFYTYKDSTFKNKFFLNNEEYYNCQEDFLEKIRNFYYSYTNVFSSSNLRKIAACGFFQNLVYLNEECFSFWGRPTYLCTKFQIDLLLYGKMYKNLIKNQAESGKPLNDEILEDPEKFVEWTENYSKDPSKNINKKAKSDNKYAVSSHVGATSKDLEKMGVKVEKIKGKSLLELAKEKGGTIEKSDYLDARENL